MWLSNLSTTTVTVKEHQGQQKTQQKLNLTSTTTSKKATNNCFIYPFIVLKKIFLFYFLQATVELQGHPDQEY